MIRSMECAADTPSQSMPIDANATNVARAFQSGVPALGSIASLLHELPRGAHVWLVSVTLPAEEADGTHRAAVPAALPCHSENQGSARGEIETTDARAPLRNIARTPLERVRAARNENLALCLKPKEWAQKTGVSERELRRAVEYGAVSYVTKRDGRDHGACQVTVDELEAYLATVDAVRSGQVAEPRWWRHVRRKGAWEKPSKHEGPVK